MMWTQWLERTLRKRHKEGPAAREIAPLPAAEGEEVLVSADKATRAFADRLVAAEDASEL
jgi:hypothetical protein